MRSAATILGRPAMKRFRILHRCIRLAIVPLCALCTAIWPLVAWAQEEEEKATQESWTLSYVLVFLGIALGLVLVCRPGRRHKEIRVVEE